MSGDTHCWSQVNKRRSFVALESHEACFERRENVEEFGKVMGGIGKKSTLGKGVIFKEVSTLGKGVIFKEVSTLGICIVISGIIVSVVDRLLFIVLLSYGADIP
jgi:hypothetical protein